MAWAAVRSRAVALLLLISCLMCFPLWGFCVSLCFAMRCFALRPFKFCNHLEEEEKAGCFAIIVLQIDSKACRMRTLKNRQNLNILMTNGSLMKVESIAECTQSNVTMCGHVHNTLVQRSRCTARCTMQIRNTVVCDIGKK